MDAADALSSKGTIELWVDLALFFGGPLQEQTIKSLCFVERKNINVLSIARYGLRPLRNPFMQGFNAKKNLLNLILSLMV
jgi:hypothetical protein